MKARFSEIKNSQLRAVDGPIGNIVDVLLEDEHWMIRYLVVSVQESSTVQPKQVLISPSAISNLDLESGVVNCNLDLKDVNSSPLLDDDQPISRQHEEALVEHYGWPVYWLGRIVLPAQQLDALAGDDDALSVNENGDANLRSAAEICGYQIRSKNGRAGTMNDLVIDLEQWSVNNGVAESSTWLPSESSMFWISHVDSVDWSKREIIVDLSKEALLPQSIGELDFSPMLQFRQGIMARRTILE